MIIRELRFCEKTIIVSIFVKSKIHICPIISIFANKKQQKYMSASKSDRSFLYLDIFILLTWIEWLIRIWGEPAISIYLIIDTVITIVILAILLFSKRRLYPVNHSFTKTELSVWRVISYGFITTVFLYYLRSFLLYPLDGMPIKDSIELIIKIGFILFSIAFLIAQLYFIRKGKL